MFQISYRTGTHSLIFAGSKSIHQVAEARALGFDFVHVDVEAGHSIHRHLCYDLSDHTGELVTVTAACLADDDLEQNP